MRIIKQRVWAMLSPPHFEDEAKRQIVNLTYPLAWAGVFITLALFIVNAIFRPPGYLVQLQFLGLMFVVSILAIWLVRRGQIQQAMLWFILFVWGALIVAMIRQGGVRSSGIGLFIIIAITPFMLGYRAGTILALLSILVGWIVLAVEIHTDWLPPIEDVNITTWWTLYSLGLLLMAIPLDLVARSLQRSLREKQKSERRHRGLFQSSPVPLWEEDFSAIRQMINDLKARGVADFRAYFDKHPEELARCTELIKVLDVNQAALDMYGAADKAELLAHLRPTFDESGYETFRNELIALAEGKTAFVGEADITYTLSGEQRYTTLRLSIVPGHEDGWERVLVSVVDLTDQVRAQQELQTLYNFQSLITNLAMDFINLSPDELDQGINEVLQRVTQFIGADAGIVFRLSSDDLSDPALVATISNEWIDSDHVSSLRELLPQVRGADYPWVWGHLRHFEVVNIRSVNDLPSEADAARSTMQQYGLRSLILVPLIIYQDQIRGFLGHCTFASERHWSPDIIALLKVVAEIVMNAMEHQRAQAHQLDLVVERERVDLLRLMIGNLSHDLKAPLSVIKANLYLAQNLPDPDRRQAKMDAILEQTERIDRLILDLMTLTRLESSVPTLTPEPLNVGLLLEDVAAQLKPLSEEKRLRLTVDAFADLPPVMGDRNELSRVFVNLVQNAINYTPEDREIMIRVCHKDGHILAEVQDTGIGISKRDLALIFDRFYRTNEARAMVVTGTGLGLPIVRRIVEIHGGTVAAESVLGEGSTFRVLLPVWVGNLE